MDKAIQGFRNTMIEENDMDFLVSKIRNDKQSNLYLFLQEIISQNIAMHDVLISSVNIR